MDMRADLDVCCDGKVSIGYIKEVAGAKIAGAKMAGAVHARVWIRGSGTSLWYLSPRISAIYIYLG